jgi:hypothetical protein
MSKEPQPPPTPTDGWRAYLGHAACVVIGIVVAHAVGEAIQPSLSFWPAFAVKVAAGGAVAIGAFLVWRWSARRMS